jgi:hypothetical protein
MDERWHGWLDWAHGRGGHIARFLRDHEALADRVLVSEFVVGLLFIAFLFHYQARQTRRWDAVTVTMIVFFVALAAIYGVVLASIWAERLRSSSHPDVRWATRIVFALAWHPLMAALLRERWKERRNPT